MAADEQSHHCPSLLLQPRFQNEQVRKRRKDNAVQRTERRGLTMRGATGEDGPNDAAREDQSETDEIDLGGKALMVYWFMLRSNRSLTAREIQRSIGLSSSSLSLHHLNKLIGLGLVSKDAEGRYLVSRKVRPGLLGLFVGQGRAFFPRFVFYAVFTTSFLVSSLYLLWFRMDDTSLLLVVALLFSSAAFWLESARAWRMQPI
jgi:hypothetical protein